MGMAIFCILSTLLIAQRILIYYENVAIAYEDIQLIIDAHQVEMDEAVENYGIAHLTHLLKAMSEDMHDKHLFLLLKQGKTLTGNLKEWPQVDYHGKDYAEVILPEAGSEDPRHLLVSVSHYRNHANLLIGYDMDRVDELRDGFFAVLLENMAVAFLVSLATSMFIVWLLSRHFRQFNIACEQVMTGNLDYRIQTEQSRDEFDMLATNINRMLEWNKTLISTVQDSTNAIAHDMRTPLSRLRLDMRALSERPKLDRETQLQVLGHVERVDGIIEMFENLLKIARAESRSSTELFEPLNLKLLIQDVLDFYAPIIEEKHLALHVDLPEADVTFKGDKQLLVQAVMNLIDNACKFAPAEGTIKVSLSAEKPITLTVADNGVGVPEELLEKVKERFFRADASRNTNGHGLGLSLVNAVAILHQGHLVLEDNHPGLKAKLILGDGYV
ncbi:MAG: sensor histidine kinase [Proteobacteria bacterium]|nr:sensor histidine kinase [Pseudomonadota bacterium]